jgi:hypothetical protein
MNDGNFVKDFLKNVGDLETNALTVSKSLLEDGKENVTLKLTRDRVMPERMESPARNHIFNDADSFVGYVTDEKTDNTIVFADIDDRTFYAVLDDHAEKGFERIIFQPLCHPQFAMLEGTLLYLELSIFDFARNLMRNRAIIADGPENTKQLAMMMQQITVSSSIKSCAGVGAKSVNGVMCTTEAKAGVDETQIDLPDTISICTPIYINTDAVRFDLDLTVTADRNGAVAVTIDSPEVAIRRYEIFEGILKRLKEIEGVLVTLGRPQTSEWEYNK